MTVLRFLGGTNIPQLKATLHDLLFTKRWAPIVDYAKEACKTNTDALAAYNTTSAMIKSLDEFNACFPMAYALKASSFRASPDNAKLMRDLVAQVTAYDTTSVMLDAEHDSTKAYENEVYDGLIREFNINGVRVYKSYQMYRRDSHRLLMEDLNRYNNIGIKLVRGAYMKEDKHVMHPSAQRTHAAYDRAMAECVALIAKSKGTRDIRLVVATHNAMSAGLGERISHAHKDKVMFAQLLGMGDVLSHDLSKAKQRMVYKYVPYGTLQESLPYLARRFRENVNIVKHILS
jgi:proline dehydrogenase